TQIRGPRCPVGKTAPGEGCGSVEACGHTWTPQARIRRAGLLRRTEGDLCGPARPPEEPTATMVTRLAGFWPYRDAQRRPTARINGSHSGWSAAPSLVTGVP